MSIFHSKSPGDDTKLLKAQTFVQVSGMDIRSNHGIELQNGKAVVFSLNQRVLYDVV